MFRITGFLLSLLLVSLPTWANQTPPLTTAELINAAKMAAKHDGYDLKNPELQFENVEGVTSGDIIDGYLSIELHHYAHPLSIYTVRTATGDVVNAFTCTLYRYPDLMQFRTARMKQTGSPAVSPEQIDGELDCLGIKIEPKPKSK